MRMTGPSNQAASHPHTDRLQFKLWDFLKMFVATVVCGVAVSAVAAAIALVLAREACAAAPNVPGVIAQSTHAVLDANSDPDNEAYPGTLIVGSGCDGDVVDALERDWKVVVNGNNIDVRVMQTFVVPDGEATVATFNALLPSGARLLRLTAHTPGAMWQAKIFDAAAHSALSTTDFRRLARQGLLIVQNDAGAISTDAIINIAAAESVTVEYTYRLALVEATRTQTLTMALANDHDPLRPNQRAARGAVWVEWIGNKPAQLFHMPRNATLETLGSQISGLSWDAPLLNADARFQIAWTM